jgi:hypothetical protein
MSVITISTIYLFYYNIICKLCPLLLYHPFYHDHACSCLPYHLPTERFIPGAVHHTKMNGSLISPWFLLKFLQLLLAFVNVSHLLTPLMEVIILCNCGTSHNGLLIHSKTNAVCQNRVFFVLIHSEKYDVIHSENYAVCRNWEIFVLIHSEKYVVCQNCIIFVLVHSKNM